ncbi:MAG: TrmH family RNA methyltransferase [Aggregatilineales bacterium]
MADTPPTEDLNLKMQQMTDARLARLRQVAQNRQRGIMVMMEDVHNVHNLSAIARSCDAFGIQQVAFSMEDEDLFDPTLQGNITSASASKWLDYRIFHQGTTHALTTLKAEGWHLLATVMADDAVSMYTLDFSQPRFDKLVVLVGNEREGLSQTAMNLADTRMTIPMQGMIQSFNVSVAAALTLFEVSRQRMASDRDYLLDDAAKEALFLDFVARA